MPRKPKFKPVITRVKLNPEQAVLTCSCYNTNMLFTSDTWNSQGSTFACAEGGGKQSFPTMQIADEKGSHTIRADLYPGQWVEGSLRGDNAVS